MDITVGIPSCNRYDTLSHTLLSIAMQSIKPAEVIIIDDSDKPVDLRELPNYFYVFKLFDEYGISWKCLYGAKRGQHWSHQLIQEQAKGDVIFRCFDGSQKVETKNGLIKIRDIKVGDLVKTHFNRYRKVIKTYEIPYKQNSEILWVYTKNSIIKCTPEHPFLIKGGKYTKWVGAHKLKVGDKLLYPILDRKRPNRIKKSFVKFNCKSGGKNGRPLYVFDKIEVDSDLARFFGLYLAEGCGGHDSIRFTFNNKEIEYINFISRVCVHKFFRKPTIYTRWATTVKLNIRSFGKRFTTWFGNDATNKRVPKFVYSWSLINRLHFLKGYLDGDGWVHGGKMVSFASTSRLLCEDLKKMLRGCGIDCTEPYFKNPCTTIYKEVRIKNNGAYECRLSNDGYKKMLDLLECNITERFIEIPVTDIQEKRFVRKMKKEQQCVYNLEVEEDNSYIVSCAIVHNCDDDCVAEPSCLEILSNIMQEDEKIGAVAPLVLMPDANYLPDKLFNSITDLNQPNVQWFKQKENSIREAEHLYSCFLYRKGIARYPLSLSRKGFREETLHSHAIKRAGYTLLIASEARVFHWRANSGGIRSDNNIQDYENDEKIFQSYLNLWDIKSDDKKMIVLNNGLGDHAAFLHSLPELKKKHKKIAIACCYPKLFFEHEDVELLSIAEAKMLYGDIEAFNVYKYCIENNHQENLVRAFEKMYL